MSMFELVLLAPAETVETLSDALDALDALSVSVEDADAQTPAELAMFGEPGMPPPKAGWDRSRVVSHFATDALARFQRLDGKDVFFLTGTDEHGLKMIQTAEAEKLPTMEVATRNAQRFKEMDQRLNISFDRFIRTTEEQHHRSSQKIWKRMALY